MKRTFAVVLLVLATISGSPVYGIVLRSIANGDAFVGELRPFIDGSSAPVK